MKLNFFTNKFWLTNYILATTHIEFIAGHGDSGRRARTSQANETSASDIAREQGRANLKHKDLHELKEVNFLIMQYSMEFLNKNSWAIS